MFEVVDRYCAEILCTWHFILQNDGLLRKNLCPHIGYCKGIPLVYPGCNVDRVLLTAKFLE